MDLVHDALALLAEESTMTLAIHDERGPWAAAVYFVAVHWRLYWLSEPDSRHSLAIEAGGAVAAEIHPPETDWRKLRGLQIVGRATEVADTAERRTAKKLYLERFPFAKPLLARLRGVRWYRLDPDRMVSIDNERGFGDRREVPLDTRERE